MQIDADSSRHRYTEEQNSLMIPFLHIPYLFRLHLAGHTLTIGDWNIGTFGILLWFAAVCACWVLNANFRRWRIEGDAIGIVAIATVAGIVGAKLWHVLESPAQLMHNPAALLFDRAGFAWFGGLVAGILALMFQARSIRVSPLAMLDFAAPAAAVGYGTGRLGCLTSGDGDYGIATNLPWGMSFPNGLVPTDPGVRVHPTPVYELIAALAIAWYLWRRDDPKRGTRRPVGQITGEYLVLSGLARFLVEFIRINPRVYWGMSNAQVASIGSVVCGVLLIWWARRRPAMTIVRTPRTTSVEAQGQTR